MGVEHFPTFRFRIAIARLIEQSDAVIQMQMADQPFDARQMKRRQTQGANSHLTRGR